MRRMHNCLGGCYYHCILFEKFSTPSRAGEGRARGKSRLHAGLRIEAEGEGLERSDCRGDRAKILMLHEKNMKGNEMKRMKE